ncbi:hypothetical protein NLJ89_g11009 [Agrocybe chaxingu]|uniref:Splicing factor 3B subunit 4 n=1 Tax=Agrocybe chaxingu TaxID=84603 RepID=A0A9W8JQR0_9AGAR|nr:hypothetical protein NLJ89_g11009 [Agrocybe chaxingu]
MSRPQDDRNQEATVYLGNLDERCTDALVWELMLQAGPVVNVHLPKDRISMAHQGYGFCEFLTEEDAEYACKIMNQIKLWGKPIRVNKASSDKKQLDVGANLFIGNLDENVDERLLYDTFSAFGLMTTTAKIARDPSTGASKGYGFVSYTDFEASDAAIESMNGQFLMNKAITVQYAFKKDGKGERHGTPAERLLERSALRTGWGVDPETSDGMYSNSGGMHLGGSTGGEGWRLVDATRASSVAFTSSGAGFVLPFERAFARSSGTPNESPHFFSMASMFWVYTRNSLPRSSSERRTWWNAVGCAACERSDSWAIIWQNNDVLFSD